MGTNYGTKYDRMYVACVTPYKAGTFKVDESALRDFLRYFIQPKFVQAGGGIIIDPEAGETFYLTRKEKRRNAEIAMEECGGKVPVFAGVFAMTTDEAVQCARDAKDVGVDGLFVFPPQGMMELTVSWNADKYPEVWGDFFKAIDHACDLPIIPHPSGGNWSLAGFGGGGPSPVVTRKLVLEIPNIVGWKMLYQYNAYRIIAQLFRSLDRELGRHVAILAAGAQMFHAALAEDMFDGTVSGFWNYALEPMLEHVLAWRQLDINKARKIWHSGLLDLHLAVRSEGRLHIRYKIATWLRGLIPSPFMRPPMPKPRKEEIYLLKNSLSKVGLNVISEKKIKEVTNQL